jgi:acyl carrier protein
MTNRFDGTVQEEHMPNADSTLHARLLRLLAEQIAVPAEELRPHLTFRDLGVDSLGLVELIVSVENDTGLRFPSELDGIDQDTTLETAVRVLESLGREETAAGHAASTGEDHAEA